MSVKINLNRDYLQGAMSPFSICAEGSDCLFDEYCASPEEGLTQLKTRFTVIPVAKITAVENINEETNLFDHYESQCSVDYEKNENMFENKESDILSGGINSNYVENGSPFLERERVKLRPTNMCESVVPDPSIRYSALLTVPPSLMSVVSPIAKPQTHHKPPRAKRGTLQTIKRLQHLPHGATIPALHQMNCNQKLLNRILKESLRSIEYGTSDGKNVKVLHSRTSSQLIESGSIDGSQQQFPENEREEITPKKEHNHEPSSSRGHWQTNLRFVFSCVGACLGLGNFWRLPYLCLTCGRAAFLVPLLILYCLIGMPLLVAEFTVGQFTQRGPLEALRQVCPLMQGVGVGLVVVSFFSSVYYSLILGKSILALGLAIGDPLKICNSTGDTVLACTTGYYISPPSSSLSNASNSSLTSRIENMTFNSQASFSSNTEAIIALLFIIIGAWIIVNFALWKSVNSIGKVMRISTTVPLILVSAFVIRAVTLPGATVGLQYFFDPDWNKLYIPEVWVNAGVQVLLSLNVVLGPSITLASYNKFYNSVAKEAFHLCWITFATALLAVLIVFSGLGNIAFETGFGIRQIDLKGADLAFMVYPKVLSYMPQTPIWTSLLFFLFLLLGLNSQISSVETLVTALQDNSYKFCLNLANKRRYVVPGVCATCCLFSLPFVLQPNTLALHMSNFKVVNIVLLFLASCEVMTLMWFYGSRQLRRSILQMTEKPPSTFYTLCWNYITPLLVVILWIFSWMSYEPQPWPMRNLDQIIASFIAWGIMVLSVLPVPICAVICICLSNGFSFREKMSDAVSPRLVSVPDCCRYHKPKRRRRSLAKLQIPLQPMQRKRISSEEALKKRVSC